jgi:hypothetical protein
VGRAAAVSALDLDAIEARAAAATGGPWLLGDGVFDEQLNGDDDWAVRVADGSYLCASPDDGVRGGHSKADAEFITNARADVPMLVAEVRRLQHALAEAGAR